MRYQRVKITRDQNTVYTRDFPIWEIPVLEFIFDEGNVIRLEEFLTVNRPYPDAANEFDRLTRAYGKDAKSDIAHVASVYGQAGAGIRALRNAIDEARKAEGEAVEADALLA
jgi:hypothetical protein